MKTKRTSNIQIEKNIPLPAHRGRSIGGGNVRVPQGERKREQSKTGEMPKGLRLVSPETLKREANLKIKLDVPNRYSCEITQRICADQWSRICQILEEPAPTDSGQQDGQECPRC